MNLICMFVVVDIYNSHKWICYRSKSKSLIGLHVYLYCHAVVSTPSISEGASRNFVAYSAISRNRFHLPHFGNITAMNEFPRWLFGLSHTPLCYLRCNSNTPNHNPLFTIHIDSWVYLTQ